MAFALFQQGCLSRKLVLDAWHEVERPYRIAYPSPSLAGLLAVVREGLAVAALAQCSVPKDLTILGASRGLPLLDPLPVALHWSSASRRQPLICAMADSIRDCLGPGSPIEGELDLFLPFVARHAGFEVAGVRAPFTSW